MKRDPAQAFAGVIETHSGVVFLVGDRAYKLKKPVSFGFLDFTSPDVRRAICRREVELNSRLAPDVYLGVADVLGIDGSPCEHLVVMRRLPGDRCLSVLARRDPRVEDRLAEIAAVLAAFHGGAERSVEIDACATATAQLARWEANWREMRPLAGTVFDADALDRVACLARHYLSGRQALFDSRAAAGRICDGHGDLLCDDVFCLEDGPRVLDCVEFDDRLRYVDGLGDTASLAMDLERLGRPDLGALLLGRYGAASGDEWPDSLAHHYVAYRAQVRSMVAGLRYHQGGDDSLGEARNLLSISEKHLGEARVRLVVIGGLPGSGKSTLAREVAEATSGVRVRSDEIRKKIAGLAPRGPAPASPGEGIYTPEMTRSTYETILREARTHLVLGRSVVLDATFAEPLWRERARTLAEEVSADLHEFRCVAPMRLIEARIARRAGSGDASDATVEIARQMAERRQPWPTATDVDTSRGVAQASTVVVERTGKTTRLGSFAGGFGT